jgi:uncharacterized protein YaiE (UPF0345 family)
MGTLTSLPFPETADDRTSHEGKPTYGVLSRARTRYCSPTNMHPRVGTAAVRVKAAADDSWRQHLQGNAPAIRPGSLFRRRLFTQAASDAPMVRRFTMPYF